MALPRSGIPLALPMVLSEQTLLGGAPASMAGGMPLHLLHIVPHMSEEASGPSYSVARLCASLAARGNRVDLYCMAAGQEIAGVSTRIYRQSPQLRSLGLSMPLAAALWQAWPSIDIVHNHSLWMSPNLASGLVARLRRGARLVTSPRGTLSPWAMRRSRWKKAAIWPLQREALARASCIHVTSEEEALDVRRLGFRAPLALIPNGIDLPSAEARFAPGGRRQLLFLGRIHPVKGLDLLLPAWKRVAPDFPEWELVIAGKGEGAHEREVREQARALEVENLRFLGPVYGAEKFAAYAQAQAFVLPSRSENFGVAVAEALASGLPVLTTTHTPWRRLDTEGAGLCVSLSVETLSEALRTLLSSPPERLREMGQRGRLWMQREHGWEGLSATMQEVYDWLRGSAEIPTCILPT